MQNSLGRASRKFMLPLIMAAGLATTAASAADLANNTGGPTTLTVGVPATFTMIAGINTLALPANVQKKIVITTSANLGSLSATGPGWGSCTTLCTRSSPAIAAIAMFPTLTVTTTPTAPGPFKICGTISYVPNSSTLPDTFPNNDQSCVTGTVNPGAQVPPDLAIKKGLVGTATYPGSATFVLGAFNQGPVVVNNGQAKITDSLDPGAFTGPVTFLLSAGWNCSATVGLNISCLNNGGAQGVGAFPQIKFTVKTKMKGNFKNQGEVTYIPSGGQPAETVLGNNTALIPFTIN